MNRWSDAYDIESKGKEFVSWCHRGGNVRLAYELGNHSAANVGRDSGHISLLEQLWRRLLQGVDLDHQ